MEEKEKVSEQKSNFFPMMKEILSKERNKDVKEGLEKNKSIPSDVRKALGLQAT